ncbi:phospholipid carrier-dependent glycosyltransferase [Lyngbya aestuarii]|uniref:phospholipid carrier-dependent glycosyltransferase n=1 Tax=Lyngbya aestuarii TaxID=118322 RepID=UPI00403D83D2
MVQKEQRNQFKILIGLGAIWLATALCDRLWFSLDQSIPAWDQADYLTGSLNYWQALQHPQWLSGQWWANFWQLSSKIPPLTYIATAMIQQLFGTGIEQATLVLLLFSAVILGSVYSLGVQLFNSRVGLWAAGLTMLLPGLYRYRLEFLLDYPLTAVVTLNFCCLTVWRRKTFATKLKVEKRNQLATTLIWAILFGLSLGLALMVKQTALLFLLTPILWTIIGVIRQRYWGKLAQLSAGLLVSVLVFGSWYRINWLLILTSGKRATIDSAIAEGDPALNTLDAWIYYWKILPYLVSWPLLLVPIVGLVFYVIKNYPLKIKHKNSPVFSSISWLAVFLIGGYLLCSLNINKDARYILPLLPVLSLLLAYGLNQWPGGWAKNIRWGTASLAIVLMLLNLFPLGGGFFTQILSPRVQHPPYLGSKWPHPLVIAEISQTSPYLRTTLGVLPSTPQINQHNLNYYGALDNFQVYGRQVGTQAKQVSQDVRSLSWFLTKTGDQGSVPEAQATIVQTVEQSSDFQLQQTWHLPDESTLKLYHRNQPPIQVQPLPQLSHSLGQIQLEQVTVPETAPPGRPVPVTYQWLGPWQQLQSGIVILTWQPIVGSSQYQWLHDHGIAMGELHSPQGLQLDGKSFRVTERTAMLPLANLPTGTYTLKATYLNRQTGETYPLAVPTVTLKIDPVAPAMPAPELDLITQLRTLSANLPQGPKALEPVFEETGRINQYDPIQDYLVQADLAMQYRLQAAPQKLNLAYALAFSQVLQEDAEGAIAAWQRVTQLDPQNPYAHAYLAFVYLYNWQPRYAEEALKPALALNPNIPEVQALSGIAALLQGKIFLAWQELGKIKF